MENEFLRIQSNNFKEEFHPSKLFSYTMDGIDHVMDDNENSWDQGEEEESEEDEGEEEEESSQKSSTEKPVIAPLRKMSKKNPNEGNL